MGSPVSICAGRQSGVARLVGAGRVGTTDLVAATGSRTIRASPSLLVGQPYVGQGRLRRLAVANGDLTLRDRYDLAPRQLVVPAVRYTLAGCEQSEALA